MLEAPQGYTSDNAALAFGPGSRLLFATGTEARAWDLTTGRETDRWDLPPGATDQIAVRAFLFRMENPDGKGVPFGTGKPRVCRVRELMPGGKPADVKTITDFVFLTSSRVTADGEFVVLAGLDDISGKVRSVRAYAAATGDLVRQAVDMGFEGAQVDAAGRMMAYPPGRLDRLRLMDLATGRVEDHDVSSARLLGPGGAPSAEIEYDTDGSGSTCRFYRGLTGEPYLTFRLGQTHVNLDPAFTPDGKHFFWGNQDGSVMVADLDEIERRTAPFAGRE